MTQTDESRKEKLPTARSRLSIFLIFAGVAMTIGWLVPVIYESTEEPASRTQHIELQRAGLVTASCFAVLASMYAGLRKYFPAPQTQPAAQSSRRQYGIWDILLLTTIVAAIISVGRLMNWKIASSLVVATAISVAFFSIWQSTQARSRILTVLACVFLPFMWVVPASQPFGHATGLYESFTIGPGLIPVVFVMRSNNVSGPVVAATWVICEILLGVWLARRAGWSSFVYVCCVLALSAVNSLLLHAMYRA